MRAQRSISDGAYRMCHYLRAWWRGSQNSINTQTQSILIGLRRLLAPHPTFTLGGCKNLHRLQQPSSLNWLQLLKRLIGRCPATSYYDRLWVILCCYIKFTVLMTLSSPSQSYFPFDIKTVLVIIIYPDIIFCSELQILPSQLNCLPPLQPICLLFLPTYLPTFLPHLLRNQMLLLRLEFSKAPVYSSPCSHLALICSHSFLAAAEFTNLSFWVSPLVQTGLLWGSQSNNTASEAKEIIKSNALADLTFLTPLIP